MSKKSAISNNLNNVLVIDGDSSISYHTSEINNYFQIKPSLDELFKFYQESPDVIFDHQKSIFKYDTSDCMTLILNDNTEIPLNQYVNKMNVKFLRISNDDLKKANADIIISLKYKHNIAVKKWSKFNYAKFQANLPEFSSTAELEDYVYHDYNGYENTLNIIDNANNDGYKFNAQAFVYCDVESTCMKNVIYKGYLPSTGQMRLITKYGDMINYVFNQVGSTYLDGLHSENVYFWTSDEFSEKGAYCISDYLSIICPKDKKYNVLPLYKQIFKK